MTFPDIWQKWREKYRLPDDESQRMTMTISDFRRALEASFNAGAASQTGHGKYQSDAAFREFFRGLHK